MLQPQRTTPPLTPEQKANWNAFIDFVELQKMNNNPGLDQRNKQMGLMLMNKFNFANPKQQLNPDMVTQVQQDLQDYRNNMVSQWKAGKINVDGVKSEDEIMPGISAVDGWPGSKTLSHRFPVAKALTNGVLTKDYGTDIDSYSKERGLASNK